MRKLVLCAVLVLIIPLQALAQFPMEQIRWQNEPMEAGHKAFWAGDYPAAMEQFQIACSRGSEIGCKERDNAAKKVLYFGLELLRAREYARAIPQLQIACIGGQVLGCYELAVMYRDAVGVKQNFAQAAKLFQSACTGGIAQGCNNLGALYNDGIVVGKDYAQIVALFQKACAGGEEYGCANLEAMYERSCKAGSASECSKLDVYRKQKQAQTDAKQARIAANLRPSPGSRRPTTFEGYSGPLVECMEDFPSVEYTDYEASSSCLVNADHYRTDPKSCYKPVVRSTVCRYKNLCPFNIHTKISSKRWGSEGEIIYSVLESGVEHQRFLSTSAGTIIAMSKEPFKK